MLRISDTLSIPLDDIELTAVRSQGPGGQNVNKVASAVHLRFNIADSSLPVEVKSRLAKLKDRRITADGIIVIKAQSHRSQAKNRSEVLERLTGLIQEACKVPRKRVPTRPGKAAKRRRMDDKTRRGKIKKMRAKPPRDD